jgi:hypothetical protein
VSSIGVIKKAVSYQAEDAGLWCLTENIEVAYLQQALRDLHRVIESGDIKALARIKDCAECASGKKL